MLEFNNFKNSLKSGGSWVVAIDDLALEFHGGEAGGGGGAAAPQAPGGRGVARRNDTPGVNTPQAGAGAGLLGGVGAGVGAGVGRGVSGGGVGHGLQFVQ